MASCEYINADGHPCPKQATNIGTRRRLMCYRHAIVTVRHALKLAHKPMQTFRLQRISDT